MKIVQINAVYQFGSTGRTTMEMHRFFLEKGIRSYVFCPHHRDESQSIYAIGNRFDHKVHALASRVSGKQGYYSKSATSGLIAHLRRIRPDVVILHNLHANYINVPLLLRYLAKNDIATVAVLHDCWFFTGHCCHYTEDGCYKWEKECHRCPILHKYNKSLFFDRSREIFREKKELFGRIDKLAVIGVSDWITREAKRSFLGNAKIVKRIYNWIDSNVFKPQPTEELSRRLGLASGRFIALGVAQGWREAKGLSVLLSIAKRYPDIEVVMIGKMPQGQKLPPNVIAAGTINDVRLLAKYYSMADVFINPSVQETFGKVSAEALACGTPVIANDATANPEIVGDCGVVVHDNDTEAVFEAVGKIKAEGKKRYTAACVDRADRLFEKSKNIEAYYAVCAELLK